MQRAGHSGRRRHYVLGLSLVRSFFCPSVRLLPNLWRRYFEYEWTDFDVNWYKRSTGQGRGMKRSIFGVRRSKVKVTRRRNRSQKSILRRHIENYRKNFSQTRQAHIITIVGAVVERWSLTGELSLSCGRPAADRVTTYVGKPPAIGPPTPTQNFILSGSINE